MFEERFEKNDEQNVQQTTDLAECATKVVQTAVDKSANQ